MPFGKKKSYQLVQKEKEKPQSNGTYTKISTKNISPSSSCSSTNSSKGLISKNKIPDQVKKSTKLKKIL